MGKVRGIDKAGVVTAALAVLDDGGIDAVTVRAVAAELGVKAPALYHHVRNKQDLLDEMGTEIHRRVIATIAARDRAGTGWLDDLAAYAGALREVYLAHRDGARTFSGTLITDPAVLRAQEPWLRRWTEAGVTKTLAFDAVEMTTAFVVGFVIEEQERAQSASHPARYDPDARGERLGTDVPLVVEAGHARERSQPRFERQLAVLLTGLETRAAAGS
ncbi:MAG: TetR/AcrR family transcriptional regulator C-terminal domain-containing protein [Nocardioides sp.]|uniref:TetR/AcrR family transcriptional regulator C-terminal domain-containing protein n=1 Tax=Nocardioides sp. TaxID=35761 RepID=UPI0039E689C2